MHILAEYYNFGILHHREDCIGEIICPEGFRKCMNEYLADMVTSGLSRGYYLNTCSTLHSLILYLDDKGVYTPNEIKVVDNDGFISTLTGLSSKSLSLRLCYLRRFYRFCFFMNIYRRLWLKGFQKPAYRDEQLSLQSGQTKKYPR